MNDKLLRAFIEASGFEIEEVITLPETLTVNHGAYKVTSGVYGSTGYFVTKKTDSNKSMLYQVIDQYEDGKISIDLLFAKIKIIEEE